jgi:hypothetical protein
MNDRHLSTHSFLGPHHSRWRPMAAAPAVSSPHWETPICLLPGEPYLRNL